MAIFLNILWEKFVGSARHSVEATAPINANTKYHIMKRFVFVKTNLKRQQLNLLRINQSWSWQLFDGSDFTKRNSSSI